MGWKIYTAYRMKKSEDLWPFVRDARRRAVANVREKITAAHHKLASGQVVWNSSTYKGMIERGIPEDRARCIAAEKLLTKAYRAQSVKLQRHEMDFDTTISIREHEGRLYLIPSTGTATRGTLDFLAEDPRLEDFAFWTGSDRPDDVLESTWDERRAIWSALDAGCTEQGNLGTDCWDDYLVIDVCSVLGFWKIKPVLTYKGAST